jgi:hypothetical protein
LHNYIDSAIVKKYPEAGRKEETEMTTPISKTQKRAMGILGIALADSYEAAGAALESAGCKRDAIPAGKTWRDAAKMTDDALIAAIAESGEARFMRVCVFNRAEY